VKQRTVTINGYDKVSSYQSYTICDDIFADGGNVKKGIKQMYVEGYFDSISDDYNCILDSATFIAQVAVGNEITSFPFYFSNSLTDYPYDNEWFEFVKSILQGYPNIGDVIINYAGNTITINTNCDPESLFNTNVIVRLRIEYIISCEKCNINCDIDYTQILTPTPTNTPTITPTQTPGASPNQTPTMTPTMTMTPTPTSTTPSSSCLCYTVTYLGPPPEPFETNQTVDFSYTNCAGATVDGQVGFEVAPNSLNVCARIGSIQITGGDEGCDGTAGSPCASWEESTTGNCCECINYSGTGTGTLIYTDCTGEPRNYDMINETLIFCALGGSVSYTIGITLTDNGSCNIVCRLYAIDGPGNATFMDCTGNPGQASSDESFCAANGTVFGSGSIGIINPNTCA
jgi:hypothetical protein